MSEIESRLAEVERRVRDVADREEIRELTARYCQNIALGDTEAIVALFASDGSIVTHFPGGSGQSDVVPTGTAELRETYSDLDETALKPFIHNHVIEVDGDTARGFCSVDLRLVQDGQPYTGAGHYEDAYRRVDGQWKFQRRELFVFHWGPWSKGWD
ncbi:MAG: hypothetical protein CL908_26560 [Deltaproteobacteria bacterium]|jgi:ketosteroid isomerase-like protein|nr:hypothetical protein [Deltaproteobacteria bacterium]